MLMSGTIKLQVKIEIFCLHRANFYTKYTKLVDIKNTGISSPVSIPKSLTKMVQYLYATSNSLKGEDGPRCHCSAIKEKSEHEGAMELICHKNWDKDATIISEYDQIHILDR